MATKDSGIGAGGRKPTGSTGRNRNAFCSFCRKSYRDVGPLVEGPGDVYICGECIELCQSIIDQEKRRRGGSKNTVTNIPSPRSLKDAHTSPTSRMIGWQRQGSMATASPINPTISPTSTSR